MYTHGEKKCEKKDIKMNDVSQFLRIWPRIDNVFIGNVMNFVTFISMGFFSKISSLSRQALTHLVAHSFIFSSFFLVCVYLCQRSKLSYVFFFFNSLETNNLFLPTSVDQWNMNAGILSAKKTSNGTVFKKIYTQKWLAIQIHMNATKWRKCQKFNIWNHLLYYLFRSPTIQYSNIAYFHTDKQFWCSSFSPVEFDESFFQWRGKKTKIPWIKS